MLRRTEEVEERNEIYTRLWNLENKRIELLEEWKNLNIETPKIIQNEIEKYEEEERYKPGGSGFNETEEHFNKTRRSYISNKQRNKQTKLINERLKGNRSVSPPRRRLPIKTRRHSEEVRRRESIRNENTRKNLSKKKISKKRKIREEIKEYKNKIKYKPGGKGYKETKETFYKRIRKTKCQRGERKISKSPKTRKDRRRRNLRSVRRRSPGRRSLTKRKEE